MAVIVRRDDELPAVQADRVQITQVLVNLIINAVHAVSSVDRSFPKLLISTYVNDAGLAEVAVAENGRIDDAVLPHIFDRFFTTKANGLGLGLAISRSIINSHGANSGSIPHPGNRPSSVSLSRRTELPATSNLIRRCPDRDGARQPISRGSSTDSEQQTRQAVNRQAGLHDALRIPDARRTFSAAR